MTRKITFALFLVHNCSCSSSVQAAPALGTPKLRAGKRDGVGRGLQEEGAAQPTLTIEKIHYGQHEPLRVSFTSGGLDASNWKIGIYLHDADPQDGALDPMMSIEACPHELDGLVCTEGVVEFSDSRDMEFDYTDRLATWPLHVELAYDFQLLNEDGYQMAWDVPMFIIDEDSIPEDSYTYVDEQSTPEDSMEYDDEESTPEDSTVDTPEEPMEDTPEVPMVDTPEEHMVNTSEESVVSETAIYVDEAVVPGELPTITVEKMRVIPDEPIVVSFTSGGVDASNWRIGIYPRMADPQDGALRPIVSLPACPSEAESPCTEGSVEFRDPSEMEFGDSAYLDGRGGDWPLEPQFGYDVQLLNENGSAMAWPPAMFDFIREDEEQT